MQASSDESASFRAGGEMPSPRRFASSMRKALGVSLLSFNLWSSPYATHVPWRCNHGTRETFSALADLERARGSPQLSLANPRRRHPPRLSRGKSSSGRPATWFKNSYGSSGFVTSVSAPLGRIAQDRIRYRGRERFLGIASVGHGSGRSVGGNARSGNLPLMMPRLRRMSVLVFLIVPPCSLSPRAWGRFGLPEL